MFAVVLFNNWIILNTFQTFRNAAYRALSSGGRQYWLKKLDRVQLALSYRGFFLLLELLFVLLLYFKPSLDEFVLGDLTVERGCVDGII